MVQADRKPYTLNPEKVAYWYLRLNGFLQIEDFYVHPDGKGVREPMLTFWPFGFPIALNASTTILTTSWRMTIRDLPLQLPIST